MARREVFFLGDQGEARFCAASIPGATPRGGVLIVPPFAEELNKCRRMMSLQALALADAGWLVLQPDLKGTGDSAGDFGDASWQDWLDDLSAAWDWLSERTDERPALLGVRAGGLLAAEWLRARPRLARLVLWQPVANGKTHLTQFLRLKAASEMLSDSDAKGVVASLRGRLEEGGSVEVAGYEVAAGLARGMDAAKLDLPKPWRGSIRVIEVVSRERSEHTPGVQALLARLRESGADVGSEVVGGPPFWQTVEVEECPALVAATVSAMDADPGRADD